MFVVCVVALGFAAAARPAEAGGVRMFIHHEVSDYGAWRKVYDGFSATQKKMGVTAQAVYQSADDPNDVTVTHDFKTAEKAKAFAASTELKTAMESAGVTGEPQVWFTAKAGGSDKQGGTRMFVHHEVTDYAAWRKVYDEFGATRRKMGVIAQAVYRSEDNPNDVTVTHDFKTADEAKAFAASPELKEAMGKAGVAGEPKIWFTSKAGK